MKEKVISPGSGAGMLLLIAVAVFLFVIRLIAPGFGVLLLSLTLMAGFTIVNPNESMVCTLFGSYTGTIRSNGFFWVNPFYLRKKIRFVLATWTPRPSK